MFCLKQKSMFKLDVVSFQNSDVLFLERSFAMMVFLIPDVFLDDAHLRITDRKSSVALLPFEMCAEQSFFVHPCRRTPFDLLDHVGYGDRRWKMGKNMDVIGNASDLNHVTVFLTNDSTDVFVQPILAFVGDERPAIFCPEHNVIDQFRE